MSHTNGLEARLSRLFLEKLNVEVPSADTDLINTGLLDSLAFVELLAQLEAAFGIRVSLEDLDLERFRTIAGIADFITMKTA